MLAFHTKSFHIQISAVLTCTNVILEHTVYVWLLSKLTLDIVDSQKKWFLGCKIRPWRPMSVFFFYCCRSVDKSDNDQSRGQVCHRTDLTTSLSQTGLWTCLLQTIPVDRSATDHTRGQVCYLAYIRTGLRITICLIIIDMSIYIK